MPAQISLPVAGVRVRCQSFLHSVKTRLQPLLVRLQLAASPDKCHTGTGKSVPKGRSPSSEHADLRADLQASAYAFVFQRQAHSPLNIFY